jgi:hypothetical protein
MPVLKRTSIILTRKPPPLHLTVKEFRNEVRKDVKKVAEKGKTAYESIVGNWSETTRPTFSTVVQIGEKRGVLFRIRVKEADPDKPIWMWINKTGTKSHPITPKTSGELLFFVWDGVKGSYQSKTGHSPARYGGPGIAPGKLTAAREVNHPGFPPRRFSEIINPELNQEYRQAVYNGGRRGLRKAREKADKAAKKSSA